MDFLFDGIASALSALYDLTGSYAGAIMLLTLGVMILVTPLTLKSTRSMIAMQQLQPELRKLQAKHKDDRQKLNEEMMAFYKEHNISPLGGCLPLIVQTPVFIVLYQVLNGLTRKRSYGEDMGTAVAGFVRDAGSEGRFDLFGTFDPKYLDHTTNLYQDLSRAREMPGFGLDLADTFSNRLSDGGLAHAFPYLVLVLIVAVTAFYQQRQIMARNSGNQSQINPQQQALMKIMPFFLPVFSLTLPAGIVLYFVVSNLYRIGQQAFITHTMYSEDAKAAREAQLKAKGIDTKVSRDETVPEGRKGLFGGLIHLPDRDAPASNGASKGKGKVDMTKSGGRSGAGKGKGAAAKGSGGRATTTKAPAKGGAPKGAAAKGPNRQAPSRSAPSPQNRSKNKKKRK
ncbi:YidC/Oxa1 family membrane protein insertase [Iamia sp. SCSIO 61187]|uniref:YidC/Oxa1 family membrane protein insertase n=1 Tax=Iamia sp. SCSIO 61187 TaxID=2722752 RepID=UPI001C62FA80|nr:YidC/Oxa1 family membrane protein insertase [Iamia sp. SCSIO 61187]QYG95307.1 YidC/Oxa1 family membrane protein insertase [Iamia sp. SCSIO 61187]